MAHLLLPTDLSDQSLKAAQLALDFFGAEGTHFTLVHAFGAVGLTDPMLPADLSALQTAHDQALGEFEQRLRDSRDLTGARVRAVASFGSLPELVDELAREEDIDLVLMSSGGKDGSTLFGSATSHLMLSTHLPVLEIPHGQSTLTFRRILFADDHGALGPHTLDMLAAIARLSQGEVILAHVATGRPASELIDNGDTLAQAFQGIPLRTVQVEHNNVTEALFDLARKEEVDLIAVLHRHQGLWGGLFHTSVTKDVALHSPIPVLALEQ